MCAEIQEPEGHHEPLRSQRHSYVWMVGVGLVILGVLGMVGYGGYRFAQRWVERRNLESALRFAEGQDLWRAQLLLEQAVQVNPGSLSAQRALAEFLDRTGSPDALARWREVVRLAPADDGARLRLASAALAARETDEARTALRAVSPGGDRLPEFHRLASALALVDGDAAALESHLAALVAADPRSERHRFNLAAQQLRSGDPAVVAAARRTLESLARGDALRIRAMLELIADAPRRWPDAADSLQRLAGVVLVPDRPLSLQRGSAPVPSRADLLDHLLAQPNPIPTDAARLVEWFTSRGEGGLALAWLDGQRPELAAASALVAAAANAALQAGQWSRLRRLLEQGAWGRVPAEVVDSAFALHARRPSREEVRAAWTWILERAQGGRDALRALWRLALAWKWEVEAERTLRTAVRLHPGESWAWEGLAALLLERRDAARLLEHLDRWCRAAPDRTGIQVERVLLAFLLGRLTPELQTQAARLRDAHRDDPGCALAHALVLRQRGDLPGALAELERVRLPYRAEPRLALYHGALLAEAGRAEESSRLLQVAATAVVLPEEQKLAAESASRNAAASRSPRLPR